MELAVQGQHRAWRAEAPAPAAPAIGGEVGTQTPDCAPQKHGCQQIRLWGVLGQAEQTPTPFPAQFV